MVFIYPGRSFHTNQNNSKVILFEECLGVDPFGPRLVVLELSHFVRQVKVREIGDHRPVIRCKWNRHEPTFLLKIV